MSVQDERIDYFLMLTRLMSEADSQLEADIMDPGSHPYAEDLATLHEAIQMAEEAAARIVLSLIAAKRSAPIAERDAASRPARH